MSRFDESIPFQSKGNLTKQKEFEKFLADIIHMDGLLVSAEATIEYEEQRQNCYQ